MSPAGPSPRNPSRRTRIDGDRLTKIREARPDLPWERIPQPRPDEPQGDTDPTAVVFDSVPDDVPIALLPVRLETRFRTTGRKQRLRIRIFPDPILIDAHDEALTAVEVELGRAFWVHAFQMAGDPDQMSLGRQWLIDSLGEPRARWVAQQTRPTNAKQITDRVQPEFVKVEVRSTPIPTQARLLPDRWVVAVTSGQEFRRTYLSDYVDRSSPLAVAPQLAEMPDGGGIREFLDAQGLTWRHSFEAAVAAGMGVEIPVEGDAVTRGYDSVIVFGLLDGDRADDLAATLVQHRYADGWRLLPQGTPTSNTDAGRVPPLPPDTPEFEAVPPATANRVAAIGEPSDVYTATQAQAGALALGLPTTEAFAGEALSERRDGEWSRAMNQVLWPGIHAEVLDGLLARGPRLISPETRGLLRDVFVNYARGRALLPTPAVGGHPYGLLPIMVLPYFLDPPGPSALDRVATELANLELAWVAADPANLTPTATSGEGTDADEAVEVGRLLGAVPHPRTFRVRTGVLERDEIVAAYESADATMRALSDDVPTRVYNHPQDYYDALGDGLPAGTQLRRLENLRDLLTADLWRYEDLDPNPVPPLLDHINDVMIPMIEAHKNRSLIHNLILEMGSTDITDPGDPDLFFINYQPVADDAPAVSIVGAPDDLVDRLDRRIETARSVAAGSSVTLDDDEPRSLLFALIDQSLQRATKDGASMILEGLVRLRSLVADGESHEDPAVEMERLTRETIGLFTHRFDGWRTALAAHRLGQMRVKRPKGLTVGCYGWVTDLVADDGEPDTDGFIHAPSLDRAATAAVLRSAWRGLGQSVATDPFAVDLSSDRVRRAHWLLEGLRNGHELDQLLGQRLERRLHDAGMDDLIDDFRRAVLDATGQAGQPASAIIDGLAVATAYRTREGAVFDALEAVRKGAGRPAAPVRDVLASAEADFDAVADLLMADSVASLVEGDLLRASASMATITSTPGGITRPDVADIDTSSRVVTHRITAIMAPATARVRTLPGTVDPTLDHWLRTMLPTLATLEVSGEVDGHGWSATLGDLGIGATHLVTWCPANVPLADSPLAQVLAGIAIRATADERVGGADDGRAVSVALDLSALEDAAVAAGALGDALGQARALAPGDLADATSVDEPLLPSVDIDELTERAQQVVDQLGRLADALERTRRWPDVIADLALIDRGGALSLLAVSSPEAVESAVGALVATVRARAATLDAALAGPSAANPDAVADALRAAVGWTLPLTQVLTVPDGLFGETPGKMLRQGRLRLGSEARVRSWMLAAGRVHDGLGAVHQATMMAEVLGDNRVLDAHLIQYPLDGAVQDGWAALDLPDFAAGRSRLCVLSITDPAPALKAGRACGLRFDGWAETIPGDEVTTGVAVNVDAPSSRAPNAVLLAVPPKGRRWDGDLMVETLEQTLRAARHRAVGTETMKSYGHLIPAVFVAGKGELLTEADVAPADGEETDG